LTGFEFSPDVDTIFTFNNDTFEEMIRIVINPAGGRHDLKNKTITLRREEEDVLYNFEGKEVK